MSGGSCVDLRRYQEDPKTYEVYSMVVSGKKNYKAHIEKKPEVKTCPKCSFVLKGNEKFCPECGSTTKKEERKCSGCNTLIQGGEKFCPNCGMSTAQPAPQA